jgi:hypothetical protein
MTSGTPPQLLTEDQYWRDYEIIRNNIYAAVVSCHTHNVITHVAANDTDVLQKLRRHGEFWNLTLANLQTTVFIVLAQIFDPDPSVHSIHQVLNATTAHPEFFSKTALRTRKLKMSAAGSEWNPADLDRYVENAWEPTVPDLRLLKRALAPHKAKFDANYKPLRDQVYAPIVVKDELLVAVLFSKTLKKEIDEILCFLHSLIFAIKELAVNAVGLTLTQPSQLS